MLLLILSAITVHAQEMHRLFSTGLTLLAQGQERRTRYRLG